MQLPEPLPGRTGHIGGIESLTVDGTVWYFGFDYSLDVVLSPLINNPARMAAFAAVHIEQRDGTHGPEYWRELVDTALTESNLAEPDNCVVSTTAIAQDPRAVTDHVRYLVEAALALHLEGPAATASISFQDLPEVADDAALLGFPADHRDIYVVALDCLEQDDPSIVQAARRITTAYRSWAMTCLPANWSLLLGAPPR